MSKGFLVLSVKDSMLNQLFSRDFRYKVQRKALKLLRARACGVDVLWDRKHWSYIIGKKNKEEVLFKFFKYSF